MPLLTTMGFFKRVSSRKLGKKKDVLLPSSESQDSSVGVPTPPSHSINTVSSSFGSGVKNDASSPVTSEAVSSVVSAGFGMMGINVDSREWVTPSAGTGILSMARYVIKMSNKIHFLTGSGT